MFSLRLTTHFTMDRNDANNKKVVALVIMK